MDWYVRDFASRDLLLAWRLGDKKNFWLDGFVDIFSSVIEKIEIYRPDQVYNG